MPLSLHSSLRLPFPSPTQTTPDERSFPPFFLPISSPQHPSFLSSPRPPLTCAQVWLYSRVCDEGEKLPRQGVTKLSPM